MLFASDSDVAAEQQRGRKHAKGPPSIADERREAIEDARELRMHRRIRHAAFLFFILPAIVTLVAIAIVIAGELPLG